MVLFININEGQEVEVLYQGIVCRGVVKYKGCVVGKKGDWVGVALDERLGEHSGTFIGRQYFQCMDQHGIFVRAKKIRFIPSVARSTYNVYYKVTTPADSLADILFDGQKHSHLDNGTYLIDQSKRYPETSPYMHHKSQAISRHVPAVTMLRPRTAFHSSTKPLHSELYNDDDFIRKPSIPKAHMPYTALRNQVARGWDNSHYVREMPLDYGRDSMKFSQWNDISA